MKQKNKKITIIGSGALATAMAKVLYDAGNQNTTIYGIDETELTELKRGINSRYFPNSINLPNFNTTNDINTALEDSSYVFLAVPSKIIDLVFADIVGSLKNQVLIINCSKGFFPHSNESLHEGLAKRSKNNKLIRGVVSLIGPSHAEEIVREIPTFVSSVEKNIDLASEVKKLVDNDYFKAYIQNDVRGAEVGASYKNVLAIASGLMSQLGGGVNTRAALLSRGMSEMMIFNKAMKGKPETIIGLTGLGDLIVTASSELSRNYTFGQQFVKDKNKALKSDKTVEGLIALEHIYNISKMKKLDLPIVNALYKTLFENQSLEKFKISIWNLKNIVE